MFQYQYAVIGGDMRQVLLLDLLSKSNHSCIYYGLLDSQENLSKDVKRAGSLKEAITDAENILLPIPMCKGEKLNIDSSVYEVSKGDILHYIQKGQRIFAGCIDKEWKNDAFQRGCICFDYMEERTIIIYNSIATAEGMLAEIIRTYPKNLHREKILLLGFGTCGKILAKKLNALDANVTVAARNDEALMEAYANGFGSFKIEELESRISNYHVIVNTIPAKILTGNILKKMKNKSVLYELASFPYGFDTSSAKEIGVTFHICSALPGKYAPASSADMLKRFIEEKQED